MDISANEQISCLKDTIELLKNHQLYTDYNVVQYTQQPNQLVPLIPQSFATVQPQQVTTQLVPMNMQFGAPIQASQQLLTNIRQLSAQAPAPPQPTGPSTKIIHLRSEHLSHKAIIGALVKMYPPGCSTTWINTPDLIGRPGMGLIVAALGYYYLKYQNHTINPETWQQMLARFAIHADANIQLSMEEQLLQFPIINNGERVVPFGEMASCFIAKISSSGVYAVDIIYDRNETLAKQLPVLIIQKQNEYTMPAECGTMV
jgi:hypothetical protein